MKQLFFTVLLLFLITICSALSYPTSLDAIYPEISSLKDIKSYSTSTAIIGASNKWYVYAISTDSFTSTVTSDSVSFIRGSSSLLKIIVVVNNGSQYDLQTYTTSGTSYSKATSNTLDSALTINSVSVSSDLSILAYTQSTYIKVMKQNSSGNYVLFQNIIATQTLYDSGISSDASILVAATTQKLYSYLYNSTSSNYDLKQTVTLEAASDNNNTKGILDLSYDGSTLAYVTYQKTLNIAKLDSSLFSSSQTFQLDSTISQIKISKQSWVIMVVYGTNKVRIYVNNSGQFTFEQEYTADDTIVKIDLSSDNNYLIIGTSNTNQFEVKVNANLYQKKMMNNAEIIMFCGVFIGVMIIFGLYCLITKKPSLQTKIEVDNQQFNRKTEHSIKLDYLKMNADDTQVEINRNSRS